MDIKNQCRKAIEELGDDYTEDELDEIRQFAEFVKNRKTK